MYTSQPLRIEHGEPALAAVGLGLVGDAAEPAAVPRSTAAIFLAVLRQEILHIHLLDLIGAVGIDLRRTPPGVNTTFLEPLP